MPYREGKKWRAKVTYRGQIFTSVEKTKRAAREWESRKLKELKAEKNSFRGLDLGTLCAKYQIYAERFSDDTYQEKKRVSKRVMEQWGIDTPIQSVNAEMVLEYLELQRTQRSANAANKDRKNLLSMWTWGKRYLSILFNPISLCETFPHDVAPQYTPPIEDVLRILAVADRQERIFLDCYLQTGARRSEIMHLIWEDINFDKRTIRLWSRKSKDGSRKYRVLDLSDELYNSLWWHWNNRKFKRNPFVFIDDHPGPNHGEPYKVRRRFLPSLCERAKVSPSFGFHALRRFVASVLDSKNVPLKIISLILGHSRPSTTDRYLARLSTDGRATMNLLRLEGEENINKNNAEKSFQK